MGALAQRDRDRAELMATATSEIHPIADMAGQQEAPAAPPAIQPTGDAAQHRQTPEMRWAWFPADAAASLAVNARSLAAAREFAATTVQRWGVGERCEDVAMVVSELLTNAVRHARRAHRGARQARPVRLGLLRAGHCVVCVVADPSPEVPVPREPGDCDETGRGLQVVAALSDQWGCTTPDDKGKILWALFAATPS